MSGHRVRVTTEGQPLYCVSLYVTVSTSMFKLEVVTGFECCSSTLFSSLECALFTMKRKEKVRGIGWREEGGGGGGEARKEGGIMRKSEKTDR